LVGTIGQSRDLDRLVSLGKLDVSDIKGAWERYKIEVVTNPFVGVAKALVIAGSDRRGTAYGVFTLSEAIGVSPWVWWADVTPQRRETLALNIKPITSQTPSVKYRGFFINDEDWGIHPWAAKTFEPEVGDIGPKTYARVCELLLRLKANYLWPAMHPCTRAFNLYPQNKIVADSYAVVMGSSHCEQMLRNNVTEYDEEKLGPWDYDKNRTNILTYWQQRLEENGKFENVYTIGMRGIHDGAMPGGGSTSQKVARLQRVIDDQRELVAKILNPDPSKVPQIFCPYKEVLTLYQHGLKVPDDVTLVWPDDNHGYIRQLSNPEEQKRIGGSGVYYHISYYGAPEDYLWLDTTPPALIWEEMRKAYANGASNVWILNVGDIKPGEIGTEFFLRLAWDVNRWNENAQLSYLMQWSGRNFGHARGAEIASALDEYYNLNGPCKPEHLHLAHFTTNYAEIDHRLQQFAALVNKVDAIYNALPREKKDAFYELVVYPVRGSALANQMHLSSSPEQSLKAYEQLQVETTTYNEQVAGGKWRLMMSSNPRNRPALQKPKPNAAEPSLSVAASSSDPEPTSDGYICFDAAHATRSIAGDSASWKEIPGLGRSGDSILLEPATGAVPEQAALEYDFTVEKPGPATVLVYCIPTQPLYPPLRLRYAVSVDSEQPMTVNIASSEKSREWATNVLRAAAINATQHMLPQPGKHTLKLKPLDPGLVFDKVVLDFGGLKPTFLGPPEKH
jgi:hypothetical protein